MGNPNFKYIPEIRIKFMKNTMKEKKMTLEKWIWTRVCRRRNKKKEIQIKTCFVQKISSICPPDREYHCLTVFPHIYV